jgi:hypothetical protein
MKRLIVILTFLTSGLFGQENPMFDSVDYFLRNKIKVVHEYYSSWYYGLPWEYLKMSFDKNKKTLRLDSIKFEDPNSTFAKSMKTGGVNSFRMRDTIIRKDNYNDTIKHFYDNKKRLKKIVYSSMTTKSHNFPADPKDFIPHVTTTTYIYEDSISKKIKRVVIESPFYIETRNFYYTKSLLSTRTSLDSNKISGRIKSEVTTYDYFPDKKLKRQTRRVTSDHCPTICEGSIEYKYDTEFPKDSTPSGIKPIPYTKLVTVENKTKSKICVEFYGYPTDKKSCDHLWLLPKIAPDSTYEVIFDPRPDQGIYPRKQYTYWSFKRDKFKEFGVLVYPRTDDSPFNEPKDTLFFEKFKIEPLFKTPKTIKIINKK